MKRLLIGLLLLAPVGASAFFFAPGGSSGGGGSATTSASDLTSGTLPAARIADNSVTKAKLYTTGGTASATTFFRGDNTWATPTGTGTVTEVTGDTMVGVATGTTTPALSLTDNSITGAKLISNVTFNTTGYLSFGSDPADSGALRLSNNTAVAWEPSTPGTDIFLALDSSDIFQVGQNAPTVMLGTNSTSVKLGSALDMNGKAIDNVTQAKMQFLSSITSSVQGQLDLKSAISRTKTFAFAIDNVIATDNVLMWRVPVAITITQANCYASADNVIGNLMECSTSDVTSCTVLDAWTVTNAVNPFTDSSMTDGAVAAGAWLRWSTTSVGTASMNRLSCTIQYNE